MGNSKIKACAVAGATFAAMMSLAAPAHADEQSFYASLAEYGILQSYTPAEALSAGQYLCGNLRGGVEYNVVYSELVDYYYTRAGKPRGSLGHVLGAATKNLCPEFLLGPGQERYPDYIPPGMRRG